MILAEHARARNITGYQTLLDVYTYLPFEKKKNRCPISDLHPWSVRGRRDFYLNFHSTRLRSTVCAEYQLRSAKTFTVDLIIIY